MPDLQSYPRSNIALYLSLIAILGAGLLYLFNPWATEPLAFSYNQKGEISLQSGNVSEAATGNTSKTKAASAVDNIQSDSPLPVNSRPFNPQIAALEAQLSALKTEVDDTGLQQLITDTDALIERTNETLQAAGLDPAATDNRQPESSLSAQQKLQQLRQRLVQLNPPESTGAP